MELRGIEPLSKHFILANSLQPLTFLVRSYKRGGLTTANSTSPFRLDNHLRLSVPRQSLPDAYAATREREAKDATTALPNAVAFIVEIVV